jgi:2,4-dienoyl-CoA reductase-like NADH-dependent reductase (Old Yellow Enzyme family)
MANFSGPGAPFRNPQFISDARGRFGRNAAPTRAIRDAIHAAGHSAPVICAGGVDNFDMAERWLAEGACDAAGAARQSLADPSSSRCRTRKVSRPARLSSRNLVGGSKC